MVKCAVVRLHALMVQQSAQHITNRPILIGVISGNDTSSKTVRYIDIGINIDILVW
jgi:hypothetical protein